MKFKNPLAENPDKAFERWMEKGAYERALFRLQLMALRTIKAMLESEDPDLVARAQNYLAARRGEGRKKNAGKQYAKILAKVEQAIDPMENYNRLLTEDENVDSSGQAATQG